jgi:hypothetical protein
MDMGFEWEWVISDVYGVRIISTAGSTHGSRPLADCKMSPLLFQLGKNPGKQAAKFDKPMENCPLFSHLVCIHQL